MTAILLYLAAGLLLTASLIRLFLEKGNDEGGGAESQHAHDFWLADGSAMQVARQLFGSEDWEYVQGLDSEVLKRRFLLERTTLALTWLGAAKSEARALMRVHRTAASTSPHLNLKVELRIAYNYVGFLFYCTLLEIAIRVRGPVELQRFVALADRRSMRLYEVVGQVFPFAQREE